MRLYRPNIAAILQDEHGRILVAERIGVRGAWQFPQGGVDEGEEMIDALKREVREELGLSETCYQPLHSRSGYRYDFPPHHRRRGVWDGQEQTYVLCRFSGSDADIDLEQDDAEFAAFRWILPDEFQLDWVPGFKREVYRQVFRDFFGIDLGREGS
ncbi:MAG: putative (di)nucleoside polyphosphate hydrolase [Verrucomicrobia bacterium]|jgi:putative (di)nucleoside polyphosphate hydrolase|nr:MAG: putative (di)nucleoside polyphosphate hydrolase [Verrucomicrobiota bacterium]